jgi:prepilin-type N-terminal cleavage/methylation domain-containing protein/prepilin-type processing-associated H-X9-DG protein
MRPRQNMRCRANDPRRVRRRQRSARCGFTLIELMLVVALLAVVTTMYFGFSSTDRQQTPGKLCQEKLQKVYLAMEIYANDHKGVFPVIAGAQTSEEPLDLLVPRYTADTSVFICPESKDSALPSGEPIRLRKISYAYYMGRSMSDAPEPLMSDRQVNTRTKNSGEAAFSNTGEPPGNNHRKSGGNILFCDGRVESSPPDVPFSLTVTQTVTLLNPKP